MREPTLRNLKVDAAETTKIRRVMKKQKLVKIPINLDADSLEALKKEASGSGVPDLRMGELVAWGGGSCTLDGAGSLTGLSVRSLGR